MRVFQGIIEKPSMLKEVIELEVATDMTNNTQTLEATDWDENNGDLKNYNVEE